MKLSLQNANSIVLSNTENDVLTRKIAIVKTSDSQESEFALSLSDNVISAKLGEFANYTEELIYEQNCIKGKITLEVVTDDSFMVQMPFSFSKSNKIPYFQIPGYLYGTNNVKGSAGKQFKLNYGGEVDYPNGSKLLTRADRSTHNSIITVANNSVTLIGISEKLDGHEYETTDEWSARFLYNGLLLDTSKQDEDIIGFTLGYEHFPKRYGHVFDDPKTPTMDEYLHGWISNCKGKTLTCEVFYYTDIAPEGIPAYGKAIREYYNQYHVAPKVRSNRKDAMSKIAEAILDEGWNDEYKFFIQSSDDYGRVRGDAAWTGGLQVAYPMLKAGMQLQNQRAINNAHEFMNSLCANAINENAKLLFEEFREGAWQVTGWWGLREDCFNWGDNPLHSAYVNGQAAYYLLKSYELTDRKNSSWLSTAQMIIDTAIKSQNSEGAYAKFFDPNTGNAMDFDGFQSCWFVPTAALLSKLLQDNNYLISAEKAIEHYYSWHQKGELYGTPMDTHDAVDEEGNLAFLAACTELHSITKNKKYIDYARVGMDYEFSWKFCYNTVFTNEPLRSLDWSSCGGSITSSHNIHIHQMGNLAAADIYYLYQQTNDEYYAQRLRDTCIWGNGTYNRFDGEFGFGLEGQTTEQFFHTDAILLPWWRPWDGGIWEAYLPWAPGCVLLSNAEDIPDRFYE
jgi:hypothetical protein